MTPTDQHGQDVMALIRELSELEYRRGVLTAQIEWHLRLRQVAADVAETRPGPRQARQAASADAGATPRGTLRAAILAALAETPGQTARQVATALRHDYETTRQTMVRLASRGELTRTLGGAYALAESHPGSGLAHAS